MGYTEEEKNILKIADELIAIEKVMMSDAYSNPAAGIGLGSGSFLEQAQYYITRQTYDWTTVTAMYRGNGIVRKIIDIPAIDSVRVGIKINSEMSPEKVKKVQKKLKKLSKKIIKLNKWGTLYGGAVGLIIFKDVMNKMKRNEKGIEVPVYQLPLKEVSNLIKKDSLKNIYIIDRWTNVSPSGEIETDITSSNYGEPKYYNITLEKDNTTQNLKVHNSWLLINKGIDLPYLEKISSNYWGMSRLEPLLETIKKLDGVSFSIANLVYQASLRVIKLKEFTRKLKNTSKKFQEDFEEKLTEIAKYQNNMSATILSDEDSFEVHNATFSGLDDIMKEYKEDVAAVSEIPSSRLWQRSPTGLSNDGQIDAKYYQEFIKTYQEDYLEENYNKLLTIICMSELGSVSEDFDWKFKTLEEIDPVAGREIFKDKFESIINAKDSDLISREIAVKELQELSETYNMFTNIDDEYIKQVIKEEKEMAENTTNEEMLEQEAKDYALLMDEIKPKKFFKRSRL